MKHGQNLPFAAIALSALALAFFSYELALPSSYRLPLLMVFTATSASIYGLSWGLVAAGVSALVLVHPAGMQILDGLLLLLSALLAYSIGKHLRLSRQYAKALARSQQLIAEALKDLPQLDSRQSLLESLPARLASLGAGGHVSVWLPQERGLRLLACVPDIGIQEISFQGVLGKALRQGKPQHVPNVHQEPAYIPVPGFTSQAELALPLFERGEVVAVLNLERDRSFWPEEVDGLVRFAKAVGLQLDRLADLETRRLLLEISLALQKARSLGEASQMALTLLLQGLSLQAGAVWEARGGRMQALAHQGVDEPSLLEVLQSGLPYGQGLAWEVYATGKPYFTQCYAWEPRGIDVLRSLNCRTFLAHPIPTGSSKRSRFVLVAGSRQERAWRKAEKELLQLFCRSLGVGFERLIEQLQRERVNCLLQELLEEPSEDFYHRVLLEAVDLVPGSEAGSLLVLEDGNYHFKAALGYNLAGLQTISLSPEAMLSWFSQGEQRALQGQARILSADETNIYKISYQSAPPEVIDTAGRVREIKANLCLPIVYRGKVLAYLNLDNLHDAQAFAEDSLRAAQFFAAPLATLLHNNQTQRLLQEAALTDPLTGLPNRRAFEKVLSKELERAVRYGHALSLAVMDLEGFKAINDSLGHAMGDQALIRVAQLLEGERRSSDHLFRWGGDEFAAIFPHTNKTEAAAVAARYVQLIESVCFDNHRLGVNIGLASYPEDSPSPDGLLITADQRMYQAKALGVPLKL